MQTDGLSYVLKEIYGIEHKDDDTTSDGDDFNETTECVVCLNHVAHAQLTSQVCMSEGRDTMVLPCRHLCLCNPCAEVLRFQVR